MTRAKGAKVAKVARPLGGRGPKDVKDVKDVVAEIEDVWEAALAWIHPPIDRTSSLRALRDVLARIDALEGHHGSLDDRCTEIRHGAELCLLIVVSGADAKTKARALEDWQIFARRHMHAHDIVDPLAQMLTALDVRDDVHVLLPGKEGDAFRRAWADERLALLTEGDRIDKATASQFRGDVVPNDAALAHRFARHAYRHGSYAHAAACARAAEQHKTTTTREKARIVRLAALARLGTPDAALLADTIRSYVALAKHGRKVWMFDWRTLAALTIVSPIEDNATVAALAKAWRTADPTFAATALLGVTTT